MEIMPQWREPYERGRASFERRFWNEEAGGLHDVVDSDHVRGATDPTFRAHQIWAVGGLPVSLFHGERARRIVDGAEKRLLTPVGLRLEEANPFAWPALLAAFAEAWVRVRDSSDEARGEARERFLAPLLALSADGSLGVVGGHVPEYLEAEPPHARLGAAFCALSVGEALRMQEMLRA
jgi:glycogen debranching enzyme